MREPITKLGKAFKNYRRAVLNRLRQAQEQKGRLDKLQATSCQDPTLCS